MLQRVTNAIDIVLEDGRRVAVTADEVSGFCKYDENPGFNLVLFLNEAGISNPERTEREAEARVMIGMVDDDALEGFKNDLVDFIRTPYIERDEEGFEEPEGGPEPLLRPDCFVRGSDVAFVICTDEHLIFGLKGHELQFEIPRWFINSIWMDWAKIQHRRIRKTKRRFRVF
jgi:hypothetical protein